MELLIRILAVSIPAALLAAALRKDSPVMAALLALAAACVMIFSCLEALTEITEFLRDVAAAAGVSGTVLSVLMKAVGIAILSRLGADLCRDAGLSSAASAAELAGSAGALYAALPIMRAVFRLIGELI